MVESLYRTLLTGGVLVLLLSGCGLSTPHLALSAAPAATAHPTVRPTPRPTATPSPPPPPVSWLKNATLLTIYGRQFNDTPILGRLGFDRNWDDLRRQVTPFWVGMHANNGGRKIHVAVHLIYGIATPCPGNGKCLGYLDDGGTNIVRQYILPAAKRHLLVVLDDQLGASNPVDEVRRMISKGYLAYDNVVVALDPEFRAAPGQAVPGIPVGAVTAAEINAAQALIGSYARAHHLRHKKLLIVHQFRDFMIQNRGTLRHNFGYADTAIVADGFGDPATKADVYNSILGPAAPGVVWRGIKLFYPNPLEQAGHGDAPLLTWPQVFGRAWIAAGTKRYAINPPPQIVIIA
jgi:hypothetical protein